jgi:hypothetical protein
MVLKLVELFDECLRERGLKLNKDKTQYLSEETINTPKLTTNSHIKLLGVRVSFNPITAAKATANAVNVSDWKKRSRLPLWAKQLEMERFFSRHLWRSYRPLVRQLDESNYPLV